MCHENPAAEADRQDTLVSRLEAAMLSRATRDVDDAFKGLAAEQIFRGVGDQLGIPLAGSISNRVSTLIEGVRRDAIAMRHQLLIERAIDELTKEGR